MNSHEPALRSGPRPMKVVARINRVVTNPIQLKYAGRAPGMAIVEHTGRRSGTAYRTPVMARLRLGHGRILLPYGSDTDWVKNLLAGGGTIVQRGRRYDIGDVRVTPGRVDCLEFAVHQIRD